MTSPARIEANRRNAQKSTGPKTTEGKARSAQNALAHGLTAEGAVLPHEDPAAFEAAQQRWLDDLQPEGEAERALVERASLASWRLQRCARSETARLAHRVRHAGAAFERAQHARAAALGAPIMADPIDRTTSFLDAEARGRLDAWLAHDPANLVRELESFAQGAEWLLARWADLRRVLLADGYWHYPERNAAARLLGHRAEDGLNDATVGALFLACRELHPEPWDLSNDLTHSCLGRTDRPLYYRRVDLLETRGPGSREAAYEHLLATAQDEIERLEALKAEHLDPLNELDRAEAADRAALDASPEGTLARRYETACERELHRALADLAKLRKDRGREHAPARQAAHEVEPGGAEGAPEAAPRNEPKPGGRPRPRRGVRAPQPPRCEVRAGRPGGP